MVGLKVRFERGWKSLGVVSVLVAGLACLSACDSKTLRGLDGETKQVVIPDRQLPESGQGTTDLAKIRGAEYLLKSIDVIAVSAEFKSRARFHQDLVTPGVIQKTRDGFLGEKIFAPEDTTKLILVDLCIPSKLDLRGNKPVAPTCNKYHPSASENDVSPDVWPAPGGIEVFHAFSLGAQKGDIYELIGNNLLRATAFSLANGGVQIQEEVRRPLPAGKPFRGEVAFYFVELNYVPAP